MLWLLACANPDPDALLRAGRAQEALAAAAGEGVALDMGDPTVEALARRAPKETWITVAVVAELAAAGSTLAGVPTIRTQSVDVSFERWAPMADCTAAMLRAPWRVVVGRSAVARDPDVFSTGRPFENVPYADGRIVGQAHASGPESVADATQALRDLFAAIDANPPAHRVTVALSEGRSVMGAHLGRREGVWWTVSANDAKGIADWVVRCGSDA